jgi:hypothetical protein
MPRLRARLRELISRVKRSLIQPIPPELEACEVCGKLRCPDDEWKSCERRIATAEFIRTGDRAALTRLEQAYRNAGHKP